MHPSVATMARTILSGANIVYNGNPLNDLSLSAFLDKLMEKKPKASTWHGGSQIEPAKKVGLVIKLLLYSYYFSHGFLLSCCHNISFKLLFSLSFSPAGHESSSDWSGDSLIG